MAQVPVITSPGGSGIYTLNQAVNAAYTCDGVVNATSCVGTVPNGSPLDTTSLGVKSFSVQAKNAAGATLATANTSYTVVEPGNGGGGGTVPATLNLNLGTPTAFDAFVPGVAKDYTSTLTAQILSTAGDATLTVQDASDTNVGKMVNGTYALPQTVQVAAQKVVPVPNQPSTLDPETPVFKPLGGAAAPTQVLVYGGPVSGSATVTFKQAIAATDALRTGSYSKTLTFVLSTTNP